MSAAGDALEAGVLQRLLRVLVELRPGRVVGEQGQQEIDDVGEGHHGFVLSVSRGSRERPRPGAVPGRGRGWSERELLDVLGVVLVLVLAVDLGVALVVGVELVLALQVGVLVDCPGRSRRSGRRRRRPPPRPRSSRRRRRPRRRRRRCHRAADAAERRSRRRPALPKFTTCLPSRSMSPASPPMPEPSALPLSPPTATPPAPPAPPSPAMVSVSVTVFCSRWPSWLLAWSASSAFWFSLAAAWSWMTVVVQVEARR